jgi:hypothetical protein
LYPFWGDLRSSIFVPHRHAFSLHSYALDSVIPGSLYKQCGVVAITTDTGRQPIATVL